MRVQLKHLLGLFALVGVSLFSFLPSAVATSVTAGCMDDLFPGNLNCTANDVRIAKATNIQITDPCSFPGDTVTFTADFEVRLTAQTRYDIGLYLSSDNDTNHDGALTGQCIVSTPDASLSAQFINLDPAPDTCGDIDSQHSPMFVHIPVTAVCLDTNGNGKLDLPNCTSWRQPGSNAVCTSPTQAFPGSPSKCNCDQGFEVDIPVPPATLKVDKTVNPVLVNEPGGPATFTVQVTNQSPFASLTLNSLVDSIYGNLDGQGTCDVTPAITISPNGTYTCSFTGLVSGNAGSETDIVTAQGKDQNGNPISGQDDATVTILDLPPTLVVDKTANPTQVFEPGGQVAFNVVVSNTSQANSDPITLSSLVDSVYGNLNGQGNCSVPQTILPGGSYSCQFSGFVSGNSGESETDIVTAQGADDEGNPVSASDSATVSIVNINSSIVLAKTANPTSINEPGSHVTFTVVITNTSVTDNVTIQSLVDSIYGDLNGQGTCVVPQVLAPSGSYSCNFTPFVSGNGNTSETDTATAEGVDDDGQTVSATDDATVTINNLPPSATLSKSVALADVTFAVDVTNTSTAEPLTLTTLDDDQYHDITTSGHDGIKSTTCSLPQTIAVGSSYHCSFIATVSTSPHTNTVTGTVFDDEGGFLTLLDSATVLWQ